MIVLYFVFSGKDTQNYREKLLRINNLTIGNSFVYLHRFGKTANHYLEALLPYASGVNP
jgi:hypothetical protein